jgi:pyridoxamine 5'-phosphate oxidase
MQKPHDNPFKQFAAWYEMAGNSSIDKPNAMVLSTKDDAGGVSSRLVLLSSFNQEGFVFHTNYLSRKGREIESSPRVALLFWWDELGYQVRIAGTAEKTSPTESDEYFAGRPHGSQVGAWASEQSQVIPGRAVLDERVAEFRAKFKAADVPRPSHWGGYRVKPDRFEFWVNRENRLHDRFSYKLSGGTWEWVRLAP